MSAEPLIIETRPDAARTGTKFAGRWAPMLPVNTPTGGLELGAIELSTTTPEPDKTVSVELAVKNNNCIYPVKLTLDVDGTRTSSEKFAVERGANRRLSMRTPQLYDAGKHLLQLGATVNGKLVQQFSKEITVPPKPARLQVTALDAPPYVYAEQQIVLRATVKNVGSLPAVSEGLSIEVDGVPVSTQQVDLGPGASEEISCAYAVPASGDSFHVQSLQASAKMSLLKPFSTDQDLADGSGLETIGSPHTVAGKRGQALKLDGESD